MMRATLPHDGAGALARVARGGGEVQIDDYAALASDPAAELASIGAYRSAVAAPDRVDDPALGARSWPRPPAPGRSGPTPSGGAPPSASCSAWPSRAPPAADRGRAERGPPAEGRASRWSRASCARARLDQGLPRLMRAAEEEDSELDAEERRRFMGIIERNADRLERLVDDLLFVAGLDGGRLRIEPGPWTWSGWRGRPSRPPARRPRGVRSASAWRPRQPLRSSATPAAWARPSTRSSRTP